MQSKSLISIIVPVYNSEKYLDECIVSIRKQTYHNIEIILVNDGSKDNSLLKCIKHAKEDARIKIIDKKNGGAGAARNEGLNKANGEYIIFIDSDDVIDTKMVEILYSLIIQYKAEIAVCNIERFITQTQYKEAKICNKKKNFTIYTGKDYLRELILGKTDCSPCNKIYLKSIIDDTRFLEGRINEDKIFLFELYQKCNLVVKTSETLYYYRFNENSVTSKFNIRSFDVLTNLKEIGAQIKEKNIGLDAELELSWIKANIILSRRICVNKKITDFKMQYKECCNVIKTNIFKILFNRYFNLRLKVYAVINIFYYFK